MKDLISKEHKRQVVLIRHGETALNADNRIRAWSDVPLNENGIEEARKAGRKLKGSGIDVLIASDLTRTLQTAAYVSGESGIPIIATTLALRPLNVGKYTAQNADKVFSKIMEHAIEKPEEPFEGGESFDSFKYRCLIGSIALLNEYKDKNVAFVTHHRNDRLFHAWIGAGCPNDLELDLEVFYQHGLPPGDITTINLKSDYLL